MPKYFLFLYIFVWKSDWYLQTFLIEYSTYISVFKFSSATFTINSYDIVAIQKKK